MKTSVRILESILSIEVGAARIEGAFLSDPELGLIWRAQTALTEACRSVSLEDITVREGDIATRPLRKKADDYETSRGSWFVGELLKVILSPGDILSDPERTVRRCLRAGIRPEDSETEISPGDPNLYLSISDAIKDAPGPFVAAMRASLVMRTMTLSASPSAERLLFMSVDHTFRGGRAGRDLIDPLPEGLGLSAEEGGPRWILLPSTSLTTGGFRIWSPGTQNGLLTFLDSLQAEIGRGLGSLPVLRRWRRRARDLASTKRDGARMADLMRLVGQRPILTGQIVSDSLSMTPRSALNLLNEATSAGIIEEITHRRSYRAWASSPMAEHLKAKTERSQAPLHRNIRDIPMTGPQEEVLANDLTGEKRALAELDEALNAADLLLKKYQTKDSNRTNITDSYDFLDDDLQ